MTKWSDIKRPVSDGWVKYFSDGTLELGSDNDPNVSWTRGNQDKMCGVSIHHEELEVYLMTEDGLPGRFWQSDDYEVLFGQSNPVRIARRIEQKVGPKSWKIIEINLRTREIKEYTSKHKI